MEFLLAAKEVSNSLDWVLPAAAGITIIGGALVAITKGGKWMFTTIRKVNEFLEDWRGEAARPGHSARPGVPERLEQIEQRLTNVTGAVSNVDQRLAKVEGKVLQLDGSMSDVRARMLEVETQLTFVKGQVVRNGGSSLRDAVDRIERQTVADPNMNGNSK